MPEPGAAGSAGEEMVSIRTGDAELDALLPLIRSFLAADVMEMSIDGRRVSGFRTPDTRSIWIRDHSDMLRAGRWLYPDVTSAVEHFALTQAASGRIFDYFTTFPEKLPCEKENWTRYVRVPVEADVEFRFVKAIRLAWQAAGDDTWLAAMLPHAERALDYIMNHPWYWDRERGLIKRAYTIDTWDFAYTAGRHGWLQFQIDEDTFWGIMHGDNSGYVEAFRIMADAHAGLGDPERADFWLQQADGLRERMNALCWNGRFYTHFVKLTPVEIAGVDEAAQLSLSNPMAINRGAAGPERAAAIIAEYRRRRETTAAFAEWFSIDPPFPDGIFGDEKLVGGAYVNGGIMPLVGGELARAAFEHGYEEYGVDILRRYSRLISERGETYLWYFPDGTPSSVETSTSPEATPTDGWGSSAMLWALIEGLAGVVDEGARFERIRLCPRWPAAGVTAADISLAYPASGARIGYRWRADESALTLDVTAGSGSADSGITGVGFADSGTTGVGSADSGTAGPGAAGAGAAGSDAAGSGSTGSGTATCHVLLPRGRSAARVTVSGVDVPFSETTIRSSRYADFEAPIEGGTAIRVEFTGR